MLTSMGRGSCLLVGCLAGILFFLSKAGRVYTFGRLGLAPTSSVSVHITAGVGPPACLPIALRTRSWNSVCGPPSPVALSPVRVVCLDNTITLNRQGQRMHVALPVISSRCNAWTIDPWLL